MVPAEVSAEISLFHPQFCDNSLQKLTWVNYFSPPAPPPFLNCSGEADATLSWDISAYFGATLLRFHIYKTINIVDVIKYH